LKKIPSRISSFFDPAQGPFHSFPSYWVIAFIALSTKTFLMHYVPYIENEAFKPFKKFLQET